MPSGSLPIKTFNISLSNASFTSSGTWYNCKTYSCEFKRFLGISGTYSFKATLSSTSYSCALVICPSGYSSFSSASNNLILTQNIKSTPSTFNNIAISSCNDNCYFGSGFDIRISAGGSSLVATITNLTMNINLYYF